MSDGIDGRGEKGGAKAGGRFLTNSDPDSPDGNAPRRVSWQGGSGEGRAQEGWARGGWPVGRAL